MPGNPSQQGGSRGGKRKPTFTPKPQAQPPNLDQVDHVLVVMSGKGGVGKSTTALNLAVALTERGLEVGLADMDITNPNLPRMVGLDGFRFSVADGLAPPEVAGLKVASTQFFAPAQEALAWRGPMKQKMILNLLGKVQWPALDVLTLDLPPGTSDEPLSIAQLIPEKASAVLVTTPQAVATEDVAKSKRFADKVGMPVLGIVENMAPFTCACGREHALFGQGGGQRVAEELEVPFLGSVPLDPRLVQAGDTGKPLVVSDPEAEASQAFTRIAEEIAAAWDLA